MSIDITKSRLRSLLHPYFYHKCTQDSNDQSGGQRFDVRLMLEKAKEKVEMTYCKMQKEHNEKQFMIY